MASEVCPVCYGYKRVEGRTCSFCGGKGSVPKVTPKEE